MKKKRIISIFLSLLLIYFCTVPAFSVNDEAEDYTYEYTEESFQSEYDNDFNKLHFYLSDDDTNNANSGIMTLSADNTAENNNHLYIDDANELDSAIESMDRYCEKYVDANEPIVLTVEFKTGYESTDEFAEFLKERETVDTIEELRSFRTRLNEFSKEYHRTEALENLEKLEQFNYYTADIIDYSPFVRLEIDKSEITSENLTPLVADDAVANVSVSAEEFVGNDDTSSDDAVSWNRAMKEIEAFSTIDSGLYTGEGIKVGVLETGICDVTHENFSDISVVVDSAYDDSYVNNHATAVASIIALMAPKAQIYSSYYSNDKGLSWFIDQGCDIVNCSFFVSSALNVGDHYNFDINSAIYKYYIDGLFDYHIKANFISIVSSAGNINSDNTSTDYNPYGYVTSPGLAYNAITVGSLDCSLGFFDYNLEYRDRSAYVTVNESAKPEVSAIGSLTIPEIGDRSGTSFAAPQVTGASALLMCKYVQGAINPHAMKALLISGANETENFSAISGSCFDDKVGAGCVSLLNMRNCGKITYFDPGVYEYQTNKTVFSYTAEFKKNDILQSSVCWFAHAEGYESKVVLLTNYDLYIYDSDENLVYTSSINNTSCEFIRYKIPSAGSYKIALYQNGPIPEGITEERIAFVYNTL